ncbi:hypothetical protein PHYPSEUDO_005129 [Phytophthora pseudosyringae]|uniref:PH domain-containing protein n=1 Tax=Phytophthora pseudosyringae TaxID=221518 RepID=A0A8T1VM42_9STRA|nr:hypothetical protein PHYPSEUDO_005129 [Phytophthora pseudosyringae]
MRGAFHAQGSRSGRHHAYSFPDSPSLQEPSVFHGKMRTAPEGAAPVDTILGVVAETVHAITVHQNKMMFQSPIGVMKEIVWDHSEKSVHFVLDDGSTSPAFVFPVLTELEAHFTAILALLDLEKPPEQVYIGVLIGQNLPSPIQQRRASLGSSQPAMLPMSKRRELLRREQPVRNAMSRERLGLEYIRSGYVCFTCSISGDLRGLTLGVHHLRVFPSPDCHDRSACLFSYSYEHLETCEVSGTRLELRFRTTHQLAKQPGYLVFQSLEAQYIREAIWYLKNGAYMDASLREMLASPVRTSRSSDAEASQPIPDTGGAHRASVLMFFADADSLKQRIDACCRVIGCENLVEGSDQSASRPDEASHSNVMIHINSGELSHMNPSVRTNPSTSRVLTNGLCDFHTSCLSSAPTEALARQKSILSRDKAPLPARSMQPLLSLLHSAHYTKMFKFQGQLLKRQNARTFHLRKTWHPKLVVLFETPVGGFLCYYDKVSHCPGMTETPKERRVIDLSSVLCIRPVSASSPVSRSSNGNTPTMHAFDVVTLYRTWTFAATQPEQYELWLHVVTECVEKHATIAPDKILRFPVKLAMTGQTSSTEATSLEISSHGVSFCTGHEAEVVLSSWYYTDLEKWSVVFQQGYTCCLLKCRSPAPASPGSPRTIAGDTITQDYLFRTAEASAVCLAIEFYVGKCMAKLEVLAGQYLEETRAQKSKTTLVADPLAAKRGSSNPKLQLQLVREHPIENVSLAPVRSPEKEITPPAGELQANSTSPSQQEERLITGTLPKADATTIPETAAKSLSMTDLFIPTPTPIENASDQPLIGLEDPVEEAVQTFLPSCTSSCADYENYSSATDGVKTLMVEMPNSRMGSNTVAKVHLEVDIHAQHQVDNFLEESILVEVALSSQSSQSSSTTEDGEDMGEFEDIDLGEAVVETTNTREEDDPEEVETADRSTEHEDPEQIATTSPSTISMGRSVEEIHLGQIDDQEERPIVLDSQVERPGDSVSSLTSDALTVSYCADMSTQETSPRDTCVATTCHVPASAASDSENAEPDNLQTSSTRPPQVSRSPPLLLLEYIPSWPGEPQQLQDNEDSTRYPTPPTEEDDRQSECEVSDRSDAFNSCASEAEPVLEAAPCGSQVSSRSTEELDDTVPDCSDDVFEDAIAEKR